MYAAWRQPRIEQEYQWTRSANVDCLHPRGQVYQCQGSKILVIMREKFRRPKKVNIKEKFGG
jgi:hypothetical protein